MGLLSSVKKKAKKFLKSDAGKLALGIGAFYATPYMWGNQAGGAGGWGAGWESFKPWLLGSQGTPGVPDQIGKEATGNLWQRSGILGKSAIVGTGAALGTAATMEDEDLPEEFTDDSGQQQYLANRALYEDEWSDWLMDMNPGMSKSEALDEVRSKPMFSEGGRVKAQGGLFAGQMPGRHPGMNQGNPMGMNQGLGAPNLGSRSMGMTPGMGQPMDPRMAQMMQAQKLQGARRVGAVPRESEDTELIQLIKMLTALGIPMEQLRGRTKEELVEMLVAVSGKGKGGTEIIEGEAIEERGGEEVEAAEEEVIQAAHGGRIGLTGGQLVRKGSGPGRQGYNGDFGIGQSYGDRQTTDFSPEVGDRGAGYQEPATGTGDGIISRIKAQYAAGNPKRISQRQLWMNQNVDKLVRAGLMKVSDEDLPEGSFGDAMPAIGYTYTGPGKLGSTEAFNALKGAGYKGGFGTGGGGGGGQSYTTAGGGTGTTADTTGDDYYKFAEWDKWLMPGETATQPP
mgnify:CR=1 FL=1